MTKASKVTKAEVQQVATEIINLAIEAGSIASMADSIRDAVSAITRQLHFKGVTVGRYSFKDESKCCPVAKAFIDNRFEFPDAVSDSTVSVILSCFRKAVKTGEDYTENPAPKAKAEKAVAEPKAESKAETESESGETETETKEIDETFVLAIKKTATLRKAASEIRKFANGMKEVKGLNLLAAMLIDVVDELDNE